MFEEEDFINENLIEDCLETIGENPFLLVKRKTEDFASLSHL